MVKGATRRPLFFARVAPAVPDGDTSAEPAPVRPMRERLTSLPRIAVLVAITGLMAGCQPQPAAPDAPPQSRQTRPGPPQPARRPVEAVHVLRDRLLARDGLGFARLAVPPALFIRLEQGWRDGRSRWPLDELPLDSRIPKMLTALQAPGAEKALMATFRRQFANADRDIDQAIRTLEVFGGEYVQTDAGYSADEREHIAQAIAAASDWAVRAPLADPARAAPFFNALAAAARRTGIEARQGDKAYAALGMAQTLNRLTPFFATLLDQLRRQYGLDLDATMRGMQATLLQQTGDSARLRVRYELAGQPIDAVVPVVRIDGHWYLRDYVARAEASTQPRAP